MSNLDLVLASSVIAAFAAAVSAVVLVPSHAVELAVRGTDPRAEVAQRVAGAKHHRLDRDDAITDTPRRTPMTDTERSTGR